MGIIVQKYGGNLVKDKENLLKVANNIIKTYNNGNQVVVVVSAQGTTTDELTNKINEITNIPIKREVDVVLSSGEQITIGLLSIILNDLGYPAISYTGWQAGIYTNNDYTNSVIDNINTSVIKKSLNENKIVIIAGFQGITSENDITTLGRGGSDTTATYLATYLKADCCEIFKDTQYIYSADPKIVKNALKLSNISYDQMFMLADSGAKVLCNKCLNFAKLHKLNLVIKSVEDGSVGTIISDKKCNNNSRIVGITKKTISDNSEKISIVLNDEKFNIEEAEEKIINIVKTEKEYTIEKNKAVISIIVSKLVAKELLIKIHDAFIN